MSALVKDSAYGAAAGGSMLLANFASALIVGRLLGVDGLGTFAFLSWVVQVIATVFGAGLPFTIGRFLPELGETYGSACVEAITGRFLVYTLLLIMLPTLPLAGLVMWIGLGKQSPVAGLIQPMADGLPCAIVALAVVVQALSEYARGYLRGTRQFARLARLAVWSSCLQVLSITIASLLLGTIGAIATMPLPGLVFLAVLLKARVHGEVPGGIQGRMFAYAKYRWGSELLAFFMWSRTEIIFLQAFWGTQAVGLFTAALTLTNVAVQGPLMLTGSLLPHMSAKARSGGREVLDMYASGTRVMALVAFPLCLGAAAIMPSLAPLLFGPMFAQASSAAEFLIVASSIGAVAIVGTNLIWAMERSDVDFYIGLLGFALSLIGAFVLIEPFGVVGAAFSKAAVQILSVVMGTWFVATRLKAPVPYASLLRFFAAALICAAVARMTIYLVPNGLGVIFAILAGAAAYIVGLRIFRPLQVVDYDQIRNAAVVLPKPIRTAVLRLVVFLERRRKGQDRSS